MYIIINCPSCSKIIMANTVNRTKTCTHCSSKIPLQSARVLARCKSTQEALETIQALKQRKSTDQHPVTFKKFKT